MKKTILVSVMVTLFCFVSDSFTATVHFQGLGDLPGGNVGSRAYGISGNGLVVVGYSTSITGGKPFRWENGVMTDLGDLPGGGTEGGSYTASADGSVIVGYSLSASGVEAFRWENNIITGLGDLPDGGFNSESRGVSANGSVVVGRATSAEGMEAFRWENGVMVGLGVLAGPFSSRAYGISADGSVIVGQSSNQAFRWTSSEGMQVLSNLPGGGGFSNALAVSANGLVIVGWGGDSSNIYGDKEAFRWENGSAIGLGDLPGGMFFSWANDVSANGSVTVGYSIVSGNFYNNTTEAFIWDADNGMRSVKDILVNDYDLDLTGWTLYNATGISDDGLTVVGEGINPNGYQEGWIATIPEPATLFLLGIGGLMSRRKH